MFTKEELYSWNELFPDCKMLESDLSHPTEGFLTKTLVAYMRHLGYKVECPFNHQVDDQPQTREKRLFLVKLVRSIDHILKITDKSYTFTYYDLLRPTPKKTAHMLGILLNYLYYYNMYKTDAFKLANDRIKTHEELQHNICQTMEENEKRKEKAAKIKDEIAQLSRQVPVTKAKVETLTADNDKQKEEILQLQSALNELNVKNSELKTAKRNLKSKIVTDAEAQELQSQYTKLQKDLKERCALEVTNEQNLKNCRQNILTLEQLLKDVADAKGIVCLKLLDDFKIISKKLIESENEHNTLTKKEQNLLKIIEKQQNELKSLEKQLEIQKKQFVQEKNKREQLISNEERRNEEYATQISKLEQEKSSLERAEEEQIAIGKFIREHVAEILSVYMN